MVPRHGKELNSFGLFAAVKIPMLISRKDVVTLLGILLPIY